MKQESQKWFQKAEKTIEAAGKMLEIDSLEFSINRAYYAMFYVARGLLADKDLRFRKHGATHGAYGQHFAKTKELDPKFHSWILEAFDQRILSDYEVEPEVGREEAQILIERAKEFLQAARVYLSKS